MTQERGARFSGIEAEKSQLLGYLKRSLDPFDGEGGNEGIRASGIYKFCTSMVDPSLDDIKRAYGVLAKMPFADLQKLHHYIFIAGQDPTGFFAKNGTIVDTAEPLTVGVNNALEAVDSIERKFDFETGELSWWADLDPEALAKKAYDMVQVDKEERRLKTATRQIWAEADLHKRFVLGRVYRVL